MLAGIMGFIYSDLMVPPLVMHYLFRVLGIMPESQHQLGEVTRFAFDYTFFLNVFFVLAAGALVWLHRGHQRRHGGGMDHEVAGESWRKILKRSAKHSK